MSVANIIQTIRGSSRKIPTLNRRVEYVKVTNSSICKNIIIPVYMLTVKSITVKYNKPTYHKIHRNLNDYAFMIWDLVYCKSPTECRTQVLRY